jgi:hypothetical protein
MLTLVAQAADAVATPGIVNTGINVSLLGALVYLVTKTMPQMQDKFTAALGKVVEHCEKREDKDRDARHASGNSQHEQHVKNVLTLQEHTTELKNLANQVRENTEAVERIAGSRAVLP